MSLELAQVLISSGILGTAIFCLVKLGQILEKVGRHEEQITKLWEAQGQTTERLFHMLELTRQH